MVPPEFSMKEKFSQKKESSSSSSNNAEVEGASFSNKISGIQNSKSKMAVTERQLSEECAMFEEQELSVRYISISGIVCTSFQQFNYRIMGKLWLSKGKQKREKLTNGRTFFRVLVSGFGFKISGFGFCKMLVVWNPWAWQRGWRMPWIRVWQCISCVDLSCCHSSWYYFKFIHL